jgi:glycosyltransferase involved in cell wall biosynthesis
LPLVTPGLSQHFVVEKLRALNYSYNPAQFITPGYIADDDLPVLYNLCKIFLFPSLSEGFGMPLVEAMACGAPVVTSSVSCLPEIAGNAAVLANPLKTDEIASGICMLAANEDLRQKKIELGLDNARRFSWKRSAERVLGLYESVYSEAKAIHKQTGFFQRHVFAPRH